MNLVPERCADCAVRDSALCASLADHELEALNAIARHKVIPRGQVFVWEGDASSICANIVSGVLKVTSATADGREQIVGLLFAGDFVGQPFRAETSLTVTALSEADLCIYPRQGFETVLDDHSKLERLLLQRTMSALDDARARMLSLGRKSAEERVAGFLLEMADRCGGDGEGESFDLPLTRGQMADVLGLTIETVSRQLTNLKGGGLIALSAGRGVIILDRAGLKGRAGTD
jgi:CRP/FNR family transcriptional regulator, anaerobic regulatory protein